MVNGIPGPQTLQSQWTRSASGIAPHQSLSPSGLESEWVETGDKMYVPRLDPGTYRFQAETLDRMSGQVSAIIEIAFRIHSALVARAEPAGRAGGPPPPRYCW